MRSASYKVAALVLVAGAVAIWSPQRALSAPPIRVKSQHRAGDGAGARLSRVRQSLPASSQARLDGFLREAHRIERYLKATGRATGSVERRVQSICSGGHGCEADVMTKAIHELDGRPIRRAGTDRASATYFKVLKKALESTDRMSAELRAIAETSAAENHRPSAETQRYLDEVRHINHDIKSNLVGAVGLLHNRVLTKRVGPQRLGEEYMPAISESVRSARQAASTLRAVTTQGPTVSRSAAGRRTVSVSGLVQSVAERLGPPAAAERGVVLTINGLSRDQWHRLPDLQTQGDPRAVERVVLNLMHNALKYANGEVNVLLTQNTHGQLKVVVADDGPGVAAADRQKIFQPYYQAAGHKPGTGLGLAGVKEIVDQLDGTIRVDGSRLGGAAFRLQLPGVPRS